MNTMHWQIGYGAEQVSVRCPASNVSESEATDTRRWVTCRECLRLMRKDARAAKQQEAQ